MSTEQGGPLPQNEVLTVKEVANYLRVSPVTVWRWCQQGVIPASQVGRNWRIRRDDVLRLFEESDSSMPSSAGNPIVEPDEID